jgi:hypothetical protein
VKPLFPLRFIIVKRKSLDSKKKENLVDWGGRFQSKTNNFNRNGIKQGR